MSKPLTVSVIAILTAGSMTACTTTQQASSSSTATATTSSSSSSPPASTTAPPQTASPSTSWLDDGSGPTEAASGDPFSAYTQQGKAPLHRQSCSDTSKLYSYHGVLYMCTKPQIGGNAYEEVVKCSQETAADRPNVGAGAKKETRKVKPPSVTVYPKLPSDKLRYELGYFQMANFRLTASGTYIYGPGQKPVTNKAVDVPMYVSPQAKDSGSQQVFTRVCFA